MKKTTLWMLFLLTAFFNVQLNFAQDCEVEKVSVTLGQGEDADLSQYTDSLTDYNWHLEIGEEVILTDGSYVFGKNPGEALYVAYTSDPCFVFEFFITVQGFDIDTLDDGYDDHDSLDVVECEEVTYELTMQAGDYYYIHDEFPKVYEYNGDVVPYTYWPIDESADWDAFGNDGAHFTAKKPGEYEVHAISYHEDGSCSDIIIYVNVEEGDYIDSIDDGYDDYDSLDVDDECIYEEIDITRALGERIDIWDLIGPGSYTYDLIDNSTGALIVDGRFVEGVELGQGVYKVFSEDPCAEYVFSIEFTYDSLDVDDECIYEEVYITMQEGEVIDLWDYMDLQFYDWQLVDSNEVLETDGAFVWAIQAGHAYYMAYSDDPCVEYVFSIEVESVPDVDSLEITDCFVVDDYSIQIVFNIFFDDTDEFYDLFELLVWWFSDLKSSGPQALTIQSITIDPNQSNVLIVKVAEDVSNLSKVQLAYSGNKLQSASGITIPDFTLSHDLSIVTNIATVSKANVSVYPNPVISELNIVSEKSIVAVQLTNILGVSLDTEVSLSTNQAVVNFANVHNGYYKVIVRYDDQTQSVHTIVK